jgi:hypothetical protein
VKGKNVKRKKVDRKWIENEVIFRLFVLSESEKKMKGKKNM